VVVELLSPGTEKEDLGQTEAGEGEPPTKWDVYEQILKVPYYILYDRHSNTLRGYRLIKGQYQAMVPEKNRFWMPELKAGLGLWQGEYEGRTRPWLRWLDGQGYWIPTPLEQAEARQAQAESTAARLAEQLRALGVDPDLG
jgi:Putative restriction endonuclease